MIQKLNICVKNTLLKLNINMWIIEYSDFFLNVMFRNICQILHTGLSVPLTNGVKSKHFGLFVFRNIRLEVQEIKIILRFVLMSYDLFRLSLTFRLCNSDNLANTNFFLIYSRLH